MPTVEEAFAKLGRSRFCSGFHLSEKDKKYVLEKGMKTIRVHAEEFVRTRLSSAYPKDDGHQTPMRGHPVFVAQHACACCCRGCLEKWYKVPRGIKLSDEQVNKIVNLLMSWIEREVNEQRNQNTQI